MKQQSITNLPLSPEAERRVRMIKYSIAMGIRVVCIVLMLFVQGWWLLVCAIGAITLPYFAVVIANVHSDPRGTAVLRPGSVELSRPRPTFDRDDDEEQEQQEGNPQ
jgi:predicted tellurium resistance membrane protein TerC